MTALRASTATAPADGEPAATVGEPAATVVEEAGGAGGLCDGRGDEGEAPAVVMPKKAESGSTTIDLLDYLFGPGERDEHTDPRLVAAWDPDLRARPAPRTA